MGLCTASIGLATQRLVAHRAALAALIASGLAVLWCLPVSGQQPGIVRPASITQPAEPIPLPRSRAEPLAPPAPGVAPQQPAPAGPGGPPAPSAPVELPAGVEILTL